MLGPIVDGASVVLGSTVGALLGDKVGANLRARMPQVFGLAAMGLGVAMIVKVKSLPPVVLALVLGSLLGELVHLEDGIRTLAAKARKLAESLAGSGDGGPGSGSGSSSGSSLSPGLGQDEFLEKFVALMVLLCVSGTGVFGAMNEGMTGDPTLLVVKAILDLFTSAIFATALGMSVAALAVPQFLVQAGLYLAAAQVMPLTTPDMLADFSASGGLILLATGFRICEIKSFAVANMLPSMFLVMPLSALWARCLG